MDDMKLKLNAAVAARLTAAPASEEKNELIEELSDNLYRRFLEMNGAGMPEDEAFHRALDDLGDPPPPACSPSPGAATAAPRSAPFEFRRSFL